MTNIQRKAEECNDIPTANSHCNTAFTESLPDGNISDRSGELKVKRHSFSKKLAREIQAKKRLVHPKAGNGVREATMVKYLAHRVHTSKHFIGGKQWFYTTVEELAKVFPYDGNTTAYELVKCLEQLGYIEIGRFNRLSFDRTLWYHVPKTVRHAAEADLIYFDAAIAEDTGIPAAVLVDNFRYWIRNYEENGLPLEVEMSPAKLVKLLPFSESTIKRSLHQVTDKYMNRLHPSKPIYGKPKIMRGSNPNDRGSKANEKGPNPNDRGSNPNDNTYCKPINNPLETRSKEEPLAPAEELPSDDKKQTDDVVTTFDEGMNPVAASQTREASAHTMGVSPFSECMSISGSSASMTKERGGHCEVASSVHEPVPVPMAGEAEHGNSQWPEVSSLRQLHMANQIIADDIDTLPERHKTLDQLYSVAVKVGTCVLSTMDLSILDDLYDDPDGDEVLDQILPLYQRFLVEHPLNVQGNTFNIFYYSVLECMVGAFLWPRDMGNSYSHPIARLISATHSLYLPLWRREQELNDQAVEEEFAEWRQEYASADAHKDDDEELSPAEKTRVFRNALNFKNKVGWIYFDQTHRTDLISHIDKPALNLVQRLFEYNPDLTPKQLLGIMDKCMEAYIKQPAPKRLERYVGYYHVDEQKWHVRMGHDLLVFVTNLHHIVRQLEMVSNCPVKLFLRDIKALEAEGQVGCARAA